MSATQRYFVLFTPVGWAVNDRDTANEYMLFGLGEDGYSGDEVLGDFVRDGGES